jgi:hypothetical protein
MPVASRLAFVLFTMRVGHLESLVNLCVEGSNLCDPVLNDEGQFRANQCREGSFTWICWRLWKVHLINTMNCKQEYQTINQLIIQQFHHPINQTRLIECPFNVIWNLIEQLVEVTTGIPIITATCIPGYSISTVTGHALGVDSIPGRDTHSSLHHYCVQHRSSPPPQVLPNSKRGTGCFYSDEKRWKHEAYLLNLSAVRFKTKRTCFNSTPLQVFIRWCAWKNKLIFRLLVLFMWQSSATQLWKQAPAEHTATSVSYFEVLGFIPQFFQINSRHKFVTPL